MISAPISHDLNMNFCVLILFLIFSVSAPIMSAQTPSDTLFVILEPITIEATNSSVTLDNATISVSTIQRSSTDISLRRASTLDELTLTIPGIWINNRENHALGERMTVRGMGWRSQFGVRGMQIILDNIPLTVADGQTILNMVDPATIHSIELLRGPSSTFWGNSSGGVLYMKTRPGTSAPSFRYKNYFGSYNTMKYEAQFSDQIGNVQLSAYGTYHKSDGFRHHNDSELIRSGLSAGFDISNDSRMEARIAYAGMPYAEHPGSLLLSEAENSPETARDNFVESNAGKKFSQVMSSVSFYHSFNTGLLSLTSHTTLRELHNPLPFGYIYVDRFAGGTRATYDFNDLPFQLQVGGEIKWQRDDRLETNNVAGKQGDMININQLENVGNQALFTHTIFPLNKFSFSLGVRADRMSFKADDSIENENGTRIFTTLNPSAGITYKLEDSRIYTNLSTSFESPTTTEFKNRPNGETGFNKNLDPERTIGLDAGIRGVLRDLDLEYDIAVFGMKVDNLIVPFEDDQERTYFRNQGKTRHVGLESQFQFSPGTHFEVDLMYTYLNVKFLDGEFENHHVPGITPHRGTLSSTLRLGRHVLGGDVEWVGTYYVNSANTAKNDSYLIVNGRWMLDEFQIGEMTLQPFFSVYNILDIRYNTSVSVNAFGNRYYEPGSGRNFQAGFSILFD